MEDDYDADAVFLTPTNTRSSQSVHPDDARSRSRAGTEQEMVGVEAKENNKTSTSTQATPVMETVHLSPPRSATASLAAEFDLPAGPVLPTPPAYSRRLVNDTPNPPADENKATSPSLNGKHLSFVAEPKLLANIGQISVPMHTGEIAPGARTIIRDGEDVSPSEDSNEHAADEERKSTWSLESPEAAMSEGFEGFFKNLSEIVAKHRPFCEIRLKRVSYTVKVPAGAPKRATFASAFSGLARAALCRPTATVDKKLLDDVSCVFKPGTLTLVLGPPQCGKTTLMQCIAGRIKGGEMKGDLLINGQRCSDVHREKIIGISDQEDNHLAPLTVKETFEFAQQCTSFYPGLMPDESKSKQFLKIKVDLILNLMGLTRVKDTVVGDDLMRGVSGGERKRVTLGEIIIGNRLCFILDEMSTGLDSATTLHLIQRLRLWAKALGTTFIISLLQPSPDVFNVFDDVMLMAAGSIIYHGPRDRVMPYFNSIGYTCPFHKDIADFLQELPTPLGKDYLDPAKANDPGTPRTIRNFVERFKRSDIFHETVLELGQKSTYEPVHKTGDDAQGPFEPYIAKHFDQDFVMPWFESTKLVLKRQIKLAMRDTAFLKVRAIQCVIVGILSGTLFWQMSPDKTLLRFGIIFFGLLFLALGGMAQIPVFIRFRSVFYKHRVANFFRTSSYVLAMNIVAVPEQVMEVMVFGTIMYWFSGLTSADNGTHYAYFLFSVFWAATSISAFLRLLASVAPDVTSAQPISGLAVIAMVMFGGFLVTHEHIPRGWIWMYWITPVSWSLRGLVINEFDTPTFHDPLNNGTTDAATIALNSLEFYTEAIWKWWAILYMVGFCVICLLLSTCLLHFIRYDKKKKISTFKDDEYDPFKETEQELEKTRQAALDVVSSGNNVFGFGFTEATLTFQNVTYTVTLGGAHKGEQLDLLKDVSGFAQPRTMTALMGSSGAGKTTLLDCLGLRKTGGNLRGDIRVNGNHIDHHTYRRMIGYVEQNDIHSPSATIREAMLFSARLRFSSESTSQQLDDERRQKFVDSVIEMLELTEQAHYLIGSALAGGLTLDQRKRVTMGVELVANPSIIFLDEPTSGLDSRAAMVVMRAMRKIAETGRTVVCTIHQPSAQIFKLFDSLLLLKRGGEVVFFDQLGENGLNLTKFLEAVPGVVKMGPNENPAEYMLETIDPSAEKKLGVDFALIFGKSDVYKRAQKQMTDILATFQGQKPIKFTGRFAASFPVQLKECLRKSFVMYWRSPTYSFYRLFFLSLVALIIGSVFYQIGTSDEAGIHSAVAVIYFTTVFTGVVNMNTVIPVMASERAVFYRERAANTYGNLPYSISTGIVELPYIALNSLCFLVIFYFMTGFDSSAAHFWFYFLLFYLYSCISTSLGQLLIVFLPNIQVCALLGSALVNIWNLTCGFLIPKPDIPNFWIWLYWANPIRYALEGLAIDQYYCAGTTADCPQITVSTAAAGSATTTVSLYVEATFGFNYDNRWMCFGVLLAIVAIFRFMIYWGLRKVRHITR